MRAPEKKILALDYILINFAQAQYGRRILFIGTNPRPVSLYSAWPPFCDEGRGKLKLCVLGKRYVDARDHW